jgi:hypothetical protein
MVEIAGDARSKEWKSCRPSGGGKLKAAWLADAVAKFDQKKKEKAKATAAAPAKRKVTRRRAS